MATTSPRNVVARALPVLLAMFLAWFAAPPAPTLSAAAMHTSVASSATARPGSLATTQLGTPATSVLAAPAGDETERFEAGDAPAVADRTGVLFAQLAAGVRGSRAPPAATA